MYWCASLMWGFNARTCTLCMHLTMIWVDVVCTCGVTTYFLGSTSHVRANKRKMHSILLNALFQFMIRSKYGLSMCHQKLPDELRYRRAEWPTVRLGSLFEATKNMKPKFSDQYQRTYVKFICT